MLPPQQKLPSPPQPNATQEVKKEKADDWLISLPLLWSPEPDWWLDRVSPSTKSPQQQVTMEGDQRTVAGKEIVVVVVAEKAMVHSGCGKDKQREVQEKQDQQETDIRVHPETSAPPP